MNATLRDGMLSMTPATTPEIEAVLQDFAVSYWLKDALRVAISRDPLNALADAELLARLLRGHFDMVMQEADKAAASRRGALR